ncbi:unnamed protein product [Leptidea sinapis]|uniref:Translation initiation factor eIF2B subunit epsilon n=1 Tax=Leptidea sinapis TaxID=189913 RepID=A0A5E4PV25_9NEOP|nr:unnamed protein product [Leptidea sinapis]
MEADKENIVQAVVIMDLFNSNFTPICNDRPMGLLPVAGIPLLNYVLDSLLIGGVGEVILFCCQDASKIRTHVKKCKDEKMPWTLTMDIQVFSSDTCQTMGDVMREIDAASLVRGHFVLLSVNTITNINFAYLLDQHKQMCKKDKGAAMTLVYKEVAWDHAFINNDKSVFIAADGNTKKILLHQKYKPKCRDSKISIPLESILHHSKIKLQHNLLDANIALCSPSVPPLFSDNFDFQNRNDFIHGILINEDILASSLYYTLINEKQYAAAITNWKTYQIICMDILHLWVYPLSIETGSLFQNKYSFMGRHNYIKSNSVLSRSCSLIEDVLIASNSLIGDMTTLSKTIIGNNTKVGHNVTIHGSHVLNNVVIKDNCTIINSFIDDNCIIEENCIVEGAIIARDVSITVNSKLNGNIIENLDADKKEKLLLKSTSESGTEWENESSGEGEDEFIGFQKNWTDSESCYSSDSSAESTLPNSPVPEDTNIFLQEVVDSLARGYEDKLKCDYLILEINSSRYAYNIQLHEVNFFVVKALLSLPILIESKSVLATMKDILKFFYPVLSNYIKTKSSTMDCLRAIEDSCIKNDWLSGRAGQIVHLLYDADVVDEDSLVEWYKDLKDSESEIAEQTSLVKFFAWLQQASEESEESD